MLADLVDPFVDLVLPRRCVGCGRTGHALCASCCPYGPDGDPFRVPLRLVGAELSVVAAGRYDAGLRAALLAYKERGRRDLAAVLARLLAGSVATALADPSSGVSGGAGEGPLVLVPVPSGRSAAAARGGDHLRRLARRAAPRAGVRVATGVLSLQRGVRDSAGLGIADRAANLDQAMAAAPGRGRRVVIVDDIVTTGATVREAHRALRAAGWSVCGAAVVAATPGRHPRPAGRTSGGAPNGALGAPWEGGRGDLSLRTAPPLAAPR